MKKIVFSIIAIMSFSLLLSSCGSKNTSYSGSGFYFDTFISITYYGPHAKEAVEKSLELAQHYDDLWNKNKEGSDIYRLNHSQGEWVKVDEDTAQMLTIASDISGKTSGSITPLIGSVSCLWDFKSENPVLPDPDEIRDALKHIDRNALNSQGLDYTITDPNAMLDVGFIAKGYAADKIKETATALGVESGWINLGGNVMVIGEKPSGEAFNIGIQDPIDSGKNILTLQITDESVVTSGTYERSFELDGVNYFHILDTKTGYPVRNNLLSVTVIGKSSTYCDALSTSLFVLGYEEGCKFLKDNYPDYRAIFINDRGEILKTY